MHVQIVSVSVAPEHRETLLEAFRINCAGSRCEAGCIRFDLLGDPEDENSFTIYEVFESEAALERHRGTAHYRTCLDALGPILTRRSKRVFRAENVGGARHRRLHG
jgi:(4S)-4-hydroxy-5-phosphonooxypentane-2,3-dione isomerase